MRQGFFFGGAALLTLAACGNQPQMPMPEEQKVAAAEIPPEVCAQTKEGIDKLSQTGGFEFTADGQATLPDEAWLQMAQSQRDQLTQLLGFHAACAAAEPPVEQKVTVRNEFGRTLVEQTVQTDVDISRLLQD